MISEPHNLLLPGFVADLRASENNRQLWTQLFQKGEQLGRERDVPDVDSEAEDARLQRHNSRNLRRTLADRELRQPISRSSPRFARRQRKPNEACR